MTGSGRRRSIGFVYLLRGPERRNSLLYVPKLHTGPLLDLLAAVFDTIFQ